VADEFDTPLRPPDGAGAVISFPFQEAGHLGEDWTTAKGDAALGEPVYSVADGWVSVAQDFANAWGKVIFICYRLPEGRWPPFVEVMYAQLNSIDVKAGDFVKRGQRIGTVGNAGGIYSVASGAAGAHLHWEVRQTVGMGLGPGFEAGASGWLGPSEFISAHRGDRAGQPLLPKVLNDAERPGWGTDY
jgi:murein DD-endopeptidase MepM/ murein hydrolase activator NlpD